MTTIITDTESAGQELGLDWGLIIEPLARATRRTWLEGLHSIAPLTEEDAYWELGPGHQEMEAELAAERAAERYWEERGKVDDGFEEWEARRIFR